MTGYFDKFVDKGIGHLKNRPNILVCPLDWGIGHATRCVPLIRLLQERDVNVIIGAGGRSQAFLKEEFPGLPVITFPGYRFKYPRNGKMAARMLLQAPVILSGIRREHRMLENLIDEHKINAVISDNRYGLWSKKIPSVFLTHQVFIKSSGSLKFLEPILFRVSRHYLNKYSEIWIPDAEAEENLSGELSHKEKLPGNYYFIGPQSRFAGVKTGSDPPEMKYDLLFLLSGPEPQRTVLSEKIKKQLEGENYHAVIVEGRPEESSTKDLSPHVKVFSHLETDILRQLILESRIIVSRPGYSTIMDLATLGKKAVFIPTPGQTEQEYLAIKFMNERTFFSMPQEIFDLKIALSETGNYRGIKALPSNNMLRSRIDNLIDRLENG
ncbi:MAG: hypothetical protein JW731_01400 [Bacteroidales bacterium]|nr:hypothetical protein [Bacteroidales bacterium]